jgi:hypothetical protein
MRRIHAKSRFGCKECKARRLKCDESRPSCIRCAQAQKSCSYLGQAPVLPSPPQSETRSQSQSSSLRSTPVFNGAPKVLEPLPNRPGSLDTVLSTSSDPSLIDRYGALHLRLLYHFEHELGEFMKAAHAGLDAMLGLFITEAFTTPYLMDELLAYSAAHKSTLNQETRHFYATEATRLQTRALTLYNGTRLDLSQETCLPMFIFSSLLGHHILFDVFNAPLNDLGAALDGLTHCIGVHRGLSAIAQASWPMFSEELQKRFLQTCLRDGETIGSIHQGECNSLLERLDASDLSPSSVAVHREAVDVLQKLFNSESSASPMKRGNLDVVQDWLILMSEDYLHCLKQRRPEALVILAYYCVLLHRAAEYWFVGDLGRRLIYLINGHLGPLWSDWLEWPNRMVEYQGSTAAT